MQEKSVIPRGTAAVGGVFAPGHLGELTQVVDYALVDAVLKETGTVQKRVRLLPSRVVVYFVLALALFEKSGYRAVWGKLVAGLSELAPTFPTASALCRARRRLGAAPLQALFEALAGPVARPDTPGACWRGLRTVAIDGTTLHIPDSEDVATHYSKRRGKGEFGYPLLRLITLVECGTRALIGAAFGPDHRSELDYAGDLLDRLDPRMLVLLDAGFDSFDVFAGILAQNAQFLGRSGARRTPLIRRRLPDGSYLSTLRQGRMPVRIIEAWITVTLQDGTVRREQWRLTTSLLDHTRWPASELVTLYHQRWEIETSYLALKSALLDGRVLRSRRCEEIDQEVYGLLTVYQALVRLADDIAISRPGLDPDRISFTVLLEAARDHVTTARAVLEPEPGTHPLIGSIGAAALRSIQPTRRPRAKARMRKNRLSKYSHNNGQHPATVMTYTLHIQVMVMEDGLTARPSR